jgi:hypothetical protein
MDQQGYATSTLGPARFIRLAEDRVLVDRAVHHLKRDGSVLVERANAYIVRPKFVGKVD